MASSIQLNSTNNSEMKIEYQGTSGIPKTVVVPDRSFTVAGTDEVIGVNQTWLNVTGSRVAGTTYTNSTGKPILWLCSINSDAARSFYVDGVTVNGADVNGTIYTLTIVVPNGSSYSVSGTFSSWLELR